MSTPDELDRMLARGRSERRSRLGRRGRPGGRVGKAAELAVLVPSSVRWASGSQDLALLRSQRGDPLPFVEGCTLTTAFPRQPVATHGDGFRLFEPFSRPLHLPPVAGRLRPLCSIHAPS